MSCETLDTAVGELRRIQKKQWGKNSNDFFKNKLLHSYGNGAKLYLFLKLHFDRKMGAFA